MPDERSPIRHTMALPRIGPDLRIARFCLLMIEPNLFRPFARYVRGRIGDARERARAGFLHGSRGQAAVEALARRPRPRGYGHL